MPLETKQCKIQDRNSSNKINHYQRVNQLMVLGIRFKIRTKQNSFILEFTSQEFFSKELFSLKVGFLTLETSQEPNLKLFESQKMKLILGTSTKNSCFLNKMCQNEIVESFIMAKSKMIKRQEKDITSSMEKTKLKL